MTLIPLSPLLLSLKIASLATVAALLLGTPIAWILARGRFPGRAVLEAIVVVPLILPPTVTGYYLLMLIGRRGLLGERRAGDNQEGGDEKRGDNSWGHKFHVPI